MSSGADIKAYREERGLSQRQLAKQIGVSQQSISAVERGVNLPEAKHDEGKDRLTLVPRKIIQDIARVRMYGTEKYGSPDNWKSVAPERYRDAAFRHFLAYLDDPKGVDEESGMPNLWHLATNIAFLCELDK